MRKNRLLTLALLSAFSSNLHAGWLDFLLGKDEGEDTATRVEQTKQIVSDLSSSDLSSTDIAAGLKQALDKGVSSAIDSLGKTDGFLANGKVSIPMPDKLSRVERALRKIGQDKYADQFVTTMNRAAESAVPLTADIMKDAIANMSFDDARAILEGPDDAATSYLKSAGGDQMREKIMPIVKDATSQAGVTSVYKKMVDKVDFLGSYIDIGDYDIDSYVTDRTVDGLFTMIAEEEQKIRQDPAQRTTDLLKSVFE